MLEDLTKELQESQTTVEETEKRKAEAEHALQSAISGNMHFDIYLLQIVITVRS